MMQGAQNPQALLQQMAANNPQMQQVLDVGNQYGGDFQKAFYAMAQQKGIDPQNAIQQTQNMMNQMGIKF